MRVTNNKHKFTTHVLQHCYPNSKGDINQIKWTTLLEYRGYFDVSTVSKSLKMYGRVEIEQHISERDLNYMSERIFCEVFFFKYNIYTPKYT